MERMIVMCRLWKESWDSTMGCTLQIGIDVLPEYRRQGIASAITSLLAVEILERGKVPFYCCAWSNIKSARNAIKSGFKPAWAQMTVKTIDMINEMNVIK